MTKFEEYTAVSMTAAWLIIFSICAGILIFMVALWVTVPDGPRQWDFGTVEDTPAQSRYSTGKPPRVLKPPLQIVPLPEAKPIDSTLLQSSQTASSRGGDNQ